MAAPLSICTKEDNGSLFACGRYVTCGNYKRFKQGRTPLSHDEILTHPLTSTSEDKEHVFEGKVMEWIHLVSNAGDPSIENRRRIPALLSSLVQIDNGATMLNSVQHSNENK
ncbi:hypothetical protein TNCV_44361 [Trichonephila clavipes]|nr:hypothetical protein TNCV_44361 [Trichonephila clavipes]